MLNFYRKEVTNINTFQANAKNENGNIMITICKNQIQSILTKLYPFDYLQLKKCRLILSNEHFKMVEIRMRNLPEQLNKQEKRMREK